MIKTIERAADRLLRAFAPEHEAEAACYSWVSCGCITVGPNYRQYFAKQCYYNYNCGIPPHCGSCQYRYRC